MTEQVIKRDIYLTPDQVDSFLAHYGVKGMKWGVRRRTARTARKDADEYAKAKMFYGEGAGTRRKLIKARVEERSKDPDYKKVFDDHLSSQDMAKRSQQAKRERRTKDTKNTVSKIARGIVNIINGNPQMAAASAVAIVSAASWAHKAGVDKIVADHAKNAYRKVKVEVSAFKIHLQDRLGDLDQLKWG